MKEEIKNKKYEPYETRCFAIIGKLVRRKIDRIEEAKKSMKEETA